MEHMIIYSPEEMKKSLEKSLNELNLFRYNNEYRDALGQPFIEKLEKWESDIASCRDSAFTIAVIGDFKRGKSTLINALLGKEVVTSDVTTETVTLNRITYGLSSNEAILSGGRKTHLTDDELKRERLEKAIKEMGEPIQRLELKRPCELLKKVTIIDTPGTGDAMQDFAPAVQECLLQADAVIYVYNVQYPISKSEQMFLKAAVLPQKYTSLFMVGNFADALQTKEDYDRMGELLKQRVRNLLPDAEIYMVSALDELCHVMGEECEETELTPVLRARFDELKSDIDKLIDLRSGTVVIDRMQRLALSMVQELEDILSAMEAGLELNSEEAETLLWEEKAKRDEAIKANAEIIDEIAGIIQKMKTEANAWMGEFVGRIVEESKHLDAMSNDDLKQYYEFYCIDLLQEAMNTCVEYHEEKLLDILDSTVEGISRTAANELSGKRQFAFRINLDNRIWTKGDTMGLVTSYVAQANYLTYVASIIADGFSGSMREKEKQKRLPELIEQISRKLTGLSAMVSSAIDQIYDDLGEKARQMLTDYYSQEQLKSQQLLEQTIQASEKNFKEREAAGEIIKKVETVLERIKNRCSRAKKRN